MKTFYNTKPSKRNVKAQLADIGTAPSTQIIVSSFQGYSPTSPGYCPSFSPPLVKAEPADIGSSPRTSTQSFSPVVAPGFWTPPTNYPLREELNALIELVDSVRVDLLQTSMIVNHIQDFMIKFQWLFLLQRTEPNIYLLNIPNHHVFVLKFISSNSVQGCFDFLNYGTVLKCFFYFNDLYNVFRLSIWYE